MDTASVVSDTDRMVFTMLANSESVDVTQLPRVPEESRIQDITEDLHHMNLGRMGEVPSFPNPPPTPPIEFQTHPTLPFKHFSDAVLSVHPKGGRTRCDQHKLAAMVFGTTTTATIIRNDH